LRTRSEAGGAGAFLSSVRSRSTTPSRWPCQAFALACNCFSSCARPDASGSHKGFSRLPRSHGPRSIGAARHVLHTPRRHVWRSAARSQDPALAARRRAPVAGAGVERRVESQIGRARRTGPVAARAWPYGSVDGEALLIHAERSSWSGEIETWSAIPAARPHRPGHGGALKRRRGSSGFQRSRSGVSSGAAQGAPPTARWRRASTASARESSDATGGYGSTPRGPGRRCDRERRSRRPAPWYTQGRGGTRRGKAVRP
jgi:hypothetical protein